MFSFVLRLLCDAPLLKPVLWSAYGVLLLLMASLALHSPGSEWPGERLLAAAAFLVCL